MNITRRDFVKWLGTSALAMGLSQWQLEEVGRVLAATTSPPVIWLQGSSCTGCSVAALNVVSPATVDDILLNKVSVKYHPTLMAAGGSLAIQAMDQESQANAGQFILVVEGGVPTAGGGRYCVIGERNGTPVTMLDALNVLGPKAKFVIAAGTCASFKGAAGAGTNVTGVTAVKTLLAGKTKNPVINISGCPAPPENLFGAIVTLLTGGSLPLDSNNRPTAYCKSTIHSKCPRHELDETRALAVNGCYEELGCKGPKTNDNCPTRKWNNGKNWCIEAGHPCIGCSQPDFPAASLYGFGRYGTASTGNGKSGESGKSGKPESGKSESGKPGKSGKTESGKSKDSDKPKNSSKSTKFGERRSGHDD